jgi:hypothetical protein
VITEKARQDEDVESDLEFSCHGVDLSNPFRAWL